MKWNVGTKIGLGFGLAIAIFVFVGFISFRSTNQLIDAAKELTYIYDATSDIDDTLIYITDIETGERGYLITGEEVYLKPFQSGIEKLGALLPHLEKAIEGNRNQENNFRRLQPMIQERINLAKAAVDLRRTGTPEAVTQLIKSGKDKEQMDQVRQVVAEMQVEEDSVLKKRTAEEQSSAEQTKWIIALGTIVSAVLGILASLVITRNIAVPLRELTSVAERITNGDLNIKGNTIVRDDEVGLLSRTFDRMSEDLRGQISQLTEGVNVLSTAAAEIVASTSQLAASANESAAAVSETTTTVEEVRQTAQLATQKAKYVSDSAQKAAQISQSGRKSTEEAGSGMTRIRLQMEAIAASMMQLSEQSQAIGQIMAVVEDLASQSTLLAVNAAIEAAKAGEHGKGFTVVAQEVKSLAEQSRAATNQVRTILGDIQKATTAAVLSTEQGSKAVEAGERQTGLAGESIQALADSVTEAAQAATQIAASSQQQLVGVDQVAGAMESIKQASTQNVASATQLEISARNLNELGQRLKQMIARYRL